MRHRRNRNATCRGARPRRRAMGSRRHAGRRGRRRKTHPGARTVSGGRHLLPAEFARRQRRWRQKPVNARVRYCGPRAPRFARSSPPRIICRPPSAASIQHQLPDQRPVAGRRLQAAQRARAAARTIKAHRASPAPIGRQIFRRQVTRVRLAAWRARGSDLTTATRRRHPCPAARSPPAARPAIAPQIRADEKPADPRYRLSARKPGRQNRSGHTAGPRW